MLDILLKKTKKAYERLGLNIENCHYSFIKDFNIYYKYKKKQNIENQFLYTNQQSDRLELDNAFYHLAKKKGIKILENTIILKHDMKNSEILVSGNKKFHYCVLVFADGTFDYGSRYQKKKNTILLFN